MVKWHPSLGSWRLHGAGYPVNIRLAYAHSHASPIDITPLQAEYFANPKSHAHGNEAHRSKRFGDVFQHLSEFVCRKSFCSRFRFEPSFTRTRLMGLS